MSLNVSRSFDLAWNSLNKSGKDFKIVLSYTSLKESRSILNSLGKSRICVDESWRILNKLKCWTSQTKCWKCVSEFGCHLEELRRILNEFGKVYMKHWSALNKCGGIIMIYSQLSLKDSYWVGENIKEIVEERYLGESWIRLGGS